MYHDESGKRLDVDRSKFAQIDTAVVPLLELDVGDGTRCAAVLVSAQGCLIVNPIRQLTGIFDALLRLHLLGVYHGDARMPNLLVCEKTLKWIDLMHDPKTTPEQLPERFRQDWHQLLKSVATTCPLFQGHHSSEILLPSEVADLIEPLVRAYGAHDIDDGDEELRQGLTQELLRRVEAWLGQR